MLTIFDSHWLPYKNAVIRAFDLQNKTIPVEFYNITENSPEPTESIGTAVNTDERGFLHYGGASGLENVECLAVADSAIIQAERPTGEILGQWILKAGDKALTANDLGTLAYSDGTMAFNPAVPREWKLRDFALASDVRKGVWQEAQTVVVGSDVDMLKLDRWQSVIYIDAGFANSALSLDASGLLDDNEPRFGIKFVILNGTNHDITVSQAGVSGGSTAVIPAGHQICACALFVFDYSWYCNLAFDDTPAELQTAVNTLVAKDTEIEQNINTLTARVMGLRYMPLVAQGAQLTATTSSVSGNYAWHIVIQNDPLITPFVSLTLNAEVIDALTPSQPWDTGEQARQVDISWPAAQSTAVQIWINVRLQNRNSDEPVIITYEGIEIANRNDVVSTDNITVGEIFMAQRLTNVNTAKTVLTTVADKLG